MKRTLLLLTLFVSTAQAFASPQTQPLDMQTYQINNLGAATSGSDAMRYDQFLTPVPTATAVNTATPVPTFTPIPSTGLLAQTAANTFVVRTITGTSNEIDVANGSGVSGNPTLSMPAYAAWTPTLTAASGTYTSTTIYYANYVRRGKLVCANVGFTGTTSTTTTTINFTLPVATASLGAGQFVGAAMSPDSGATKGGFIAMNDNSTTAACTMYDASSFTAGASRYCFSSFCYQGA